MEVDMVKQAIDSLDGFQGTISFIGGEPTLHPNFHEIAVYLGSKYNLENANTALLRPQSDIISTTQTTLRQYATVFDKDGFPGVRISSPGMFSAMGDKYLEHYEIIQDVFKFQGLNDHGNPMYHDPLLVSRKELGIPDNEWIALRDCCWIQNTWSASITPKGAFFCEVAGTLDLLFDGPGGWAVEPGWWKREVSDFADQIHWCEICGAACETYTRDANERIDDVSPLLYEKLKEIGSKKIKRNQIHVMDIDATGKIKDESKASVFRYSTVTPYIENDASRINKDKSKVFPKGFEAIISTPKMIDEKAYQEMFASQFLHTYFLVQTEIEKKDFALPNDSMCSIFSMESKEDVKKLLEKKKIGIYTAVFCGDVVPQKDFVASMKEYIINPGTLLYAFSENETVKKFVDMKDDGAFLLLSANASSLQDLQGDFSALKHITDLKEIWKPKKCIPFDDALFEKPQIHQIEKGLQYALYGTGEKAEDDFCAIQEEGGLISAIFDSNKEKHGKEFHGIAIDSPENIIKRLGEFDQIVIASYQYYVEIKESLLGRGVKEEQLIYYQHRKPIEL